jgi:DNA-binding response OmpR family regulator
MSDKGRVLIVDDNPDICILLRTNLRGCGFDAIEAGNGKVALQRIADDAPDVVLLDLMMPVLDGWGVLESLQERRDVPPIIVVSASDAAPNVERARRFGVAAYVTKPFNLAGLVGLVEAVARERRRSQEEAMEQPAPPAPAS